MKHEQPSAVCGLVDGLTKHLNSGELSLAIVAQEFIVVARDVDDARALVDFAQHLAHNRGLCRGPIPAAPKLPTVDDIADEKARVASISCEEIREHFGLAATCAEMRVRDEDR